MWSLLNLTASFSFSRVGFGAIFSRPLGMGGSKIGLGEYCFVLSGGIDATVNYADTSTTSMVVLKRNSGRMQADYRCEVVKFHGVDD